jgi:hypothetical protein
MGKYNLDSHNIRFILVKAIHIMRLVLVLALSVMLSGCLCGGTGDVEPEHVSTTSTSVTQTTSTSLIESTTTTQEPTTTTIQEGIVDCSRLHDTMDRDICWSSRAAQSRNSSLCDRIIHPDAEMVCKSVLMSGRCTSLTNAGYRIICEASLKRDPGRCRKMIYRDISLCYSMVAIYNNDTSICDMPRDKEQKALCYLLIGSCGQLTDEEDIRICHHKATDLIYSVG